MSYWQVVLLVLSIIASWIWVPKIFPYVVILGALLWFSSRKLHTSEPDSSQPTMAHRFATLLGVRVSTLLRGFKLRRLELPVGVHMVSEGHGEDGPIVLDLATSAYRNVPFCFVLRSRNAPHRFEDIVENTRIPGIRFEYALASLNLQSPLEGAANQADLLEPLADSIERWAHFCRQEPGIRLQNVFFNGRVMHTRFDLSETATPEDAQALVQNHIEFCRDLWHLLDQVEFKAPL